ncbi:MAG: hypothetical protein IPM85_15120 [Chitinophagaceae bacterium]|nr:hypothetical protein [Chitinophagaceae bacterium]
MKVLIDLVSRHDAFYYLLLALPKKNKCPVFVSPPTFSGTGNGIIIEHCWRNGQGLRCCCLLCGTTGGAVPATAGKPALESVYSKEF